MRGHQSLDVTVDRVLANCKLIYSVFISLQEAWNAGKWIIVEVGCYITVDVLIELIILGFE